MPEFPKFYSRQHITVDNMNDLIDDIESSQINHLKDFHPNHEGVSLTTTYGASSLLAFQDFSGASLTVNVSGGVGYSNESYRIEAKVPIIGEQQTSIDTTTVQTAYPIVAVNGVFTTSTGAGINYALGGTFEASGLITLGIPLSGATTTVYVNYDRMAQYTYSAATSGTESSAVNRIDLLYLEYEKEDTNPFSIDFITANRELTQSVIYTREKDSFELKTLQGTQTEPPSSASAPTTPTTDIIPLAYIHLRNGATAIYNSDQGVTQTSYIEDIRSTL